jgi:hypothetical protein
MLPLAAELQQPGFFRDVQGRFSFWGVIRRPGSNFLISGTPSAMIMG